MPDAQLDLTPGLLQRLARMRLHVPRAGTRGGVGEHASRRLGPGMEFAGYRAYSPGDELRRLDPYLEARTGELFVREGDVLERLAVTVLVDMSASMGFGAPEKSVLARRLGGALAYVGLAGTDSVDVATFSGQGLAWAPRVSNVRGAGRLFGWLAAQEPAGPGGLTQAVRALAPRLPKPGVCVVVSDWLFEAPEEGLGLLGAAGQEVVGVRVTDSRELGATLGGAGGTVALVDSETGDELNVTLTPAALERYEANLRRWQERLRDVFLGYGWTLLEARTDDDLERLILEGWAASGLVR